MNVPRLPLVSICIITYNQESFIQQAIESILNQECVFLFEIVIGEDFSSDATRTICEEYANNYPAIIRLLHSDRNLGMNPNFIRTLKECSGKYIAICEGDDYWSDPHKLDKQVKILESNTNYAACITNGDLVNERNQFIRHYLNGVAQGCLSKEFLIHRGGASYPTASILFRKSHDITDVLFKIDELAGDNLLIMILAMKGEVFYINQSTCIYRIWEGGVYTRTVSDALETIQRKRKTIHGLFKLLKFSEKPFRRYIKERISIESLDLLQKGGIKGNFSYLFKLNLGDAVKLLRIRIRRISASKKAAT